MRYRAKISVVGILVVIAFVGLAAFFGPTLAKDVPSSPDEENVTTTAETSLIESEEANSYQYSFATQSSGNDSFYDSEKDYVKENGSDYHGTRYEGYTHTFNESGMAGNITHVTESVTAPYFTGGTGSATYNITYNNQTCTVSAGDGETDTCTLTIGNHTLEYTVSTTDIGANTNGEWTSFTFSYEYLVEDTSEPPTTTTTTTTTSTTTETTSPPTETTTTTETVVGPRPDNSSIWGANLLLLIVACLAGALLLVRE